MKNLRVILISGVSGSGKTTAIKALEDIGFYCVDNLPIPLLPKFLELCEQSGGKITKVAVVEDIRGSVSYPVNQKEGGDPEGNSGLLSCQPEGGGRPGRKLGRRLQENPSGSPGRGVSH